MSYLKTTKEFHIDVFKRIKDNFKFFIYAYLIYLVSDIIIYYNSQMNGVNSIYKDAEELSKFSSHSIMGWIMLIFIWFAYLATPCLLSLYYGIKNNAKLNTKEKIRSYLKPLLNFRMYLVYSVFIISIPAALGMSLEFIPELVNGLMPSIQEYVKILADKEIQDVQLALMESEIVKEYIDDVVNIQWYNWTMAVITFLSVLLIGFSAFVFALPLVIKSKSNGFFYSIKNSFKGIFANFTLFISTILLFLLLRLIAISVFYNIPYVNKLVSVFFATIFIFYIIVGLEKFVLEKIKK